MKRLSSSARADWRGALRRYGYGAEAAPAACHWNESAYYSFSAPEIDQIEEAANTLHGLILEAVRRVVEQRLYGLMGLPPAGNRLVGESWNAFGGQGQANPRHGVLCGRLDLACDGHGGIKLLSCQYDAPDSLFEAAVVQWNWLETTHPDADQFNGLHEGLVERFQELGRGQRGRETLHLACATPDPGREGELHYLAALAEEAGLATRIVPLQEIGWDGRCFRDADDTPMTWLYKHYPWEALVQDAYASHLPAAGMAVLEPAWTLVASNHGLLAQLWELYPEHPYLTPASYSESDLPRNRPVARRALLGLDRASLRLTHQGQTLFATESNVQPGGFVYQSWPELFCQRGTTAVIQAWMVGERCLGMTVRESPEPVVEADAALVPHLFAA